MRSTEHDGAKHQSMGWSRSRESMQASHAQFRGDPEGESRQELRCGLDRECVDRSIRESMYANCLKAS